MKQNERAIWLKQEEKDIVVELLKNTENRKEAILAKGKLEPKYLAIAFNSGATPLFHSDRGFQYTNKVFQKKLQ